MNSNLKQLDLILEFLNDEENSDEVLQEGIIYDNSRLHRTKKEIKMSIHMDGMETAGIGYTLDPYIKIYDGTYRDHSGTARLSMKDCRVIHHNKGGEVELELNKDILDQLSTVLNSPSTSSKHVGKTVYEAFYDEIAERYGANNVHIYPFPDVTKTYDYSDDKTVIYYKYYGTSETLSKTKRK